MQVHHGDDPIYITQDPSEQVHPSSDQMDSANEHDHPSYGQVDSSKEHLSDQMDSTNGHEYLSDDMDSTNQQDDLPDKMDSTNEHMCPSDKTDSTNEQGCPADVIGSTIEHVCPSSGDSCSYTKNHSTSFSSDHMDFTNENDHLPDQLDSTNKNSCTSDEMGSSNDQMDSASSKHCHPSSDQMHTADEDNPPSSDLGDTTSELTQPPSDQMNSTENQYSPLSLDQIDSTVGIRPQEVVNNAEEKMECVLNSPEYKAKESALNQQMTPDHLKVHDSTENCTKEHPQVNILETVTASDSVDNDLTNDHAKPDEVSDQDEHNAPSDNEENNMNDCHNHESQNSYSVVACNNETDMIDKSQNGLEQAVTSQDSVIPEAIVNSDYAAVDENEDITSELRIISSVHLSESDIGEDVEENDGELQGDIDDVPTMKILEAHSIVDDPDTEEYAEANDGVISTGTLYVNFNNQAVEHELEGDIINNVPGVLSQTNDSEQNDPTLPRITCVEAQANFAFVGDGEIEYNEDDSAAGYHVNLEHNSDIEPVSESIFETVYSHYRRSNNKSPISQMHPTMRDLLNSPTKSHPQLATVLSKLPQTVSVQNPPSAMDVGYKVTPVRLLMSNDFSNGTESFKTNSTKRQKNVVDNEQLTNSAASRKKFKSFSGDVSHHKFCKRRKTTVEKIWYQCLKCCVWFCTKDDVLREHLSKVHKKQNRFECKLCNYKAAKKDKMELHMSGFHSKGTVKCLRCQEGFGTVTEVKKHLKSIHHLTANDSDFSEVRAICLSQSTKGYTQSDMKSVIRRRIPFYCSVHDERLPNETRSNTMSSTQKSLPKKTRMRVEEKTVLPVKKINLPVKKTVLHVEKAVPPLKKKVKVEIKNEADEVENEIEVKPVLGLFCKECHFFVDGELRRQEKTDILESHMLKEHNIFRYQCNECSFSSSDRNEVRNHVKSDHVMWTYKCKVCRRYWSEESQMIEHFREKHPHLKAGKKKMFRRVQDMCFANQYHDVTLQLYTASVMPETGLTNFEATQDYDYNIQCKFCTCFMGNCQHESLIFAMKNHVERSHREQADIDLENIYNIVNVAKGGTQESESVTTNSDEEVETDDDIKERGKDIDNKIDSKYENDVVKDCKEKMNSEGKPPLKMVIKCAGNNATASTSATVEWDDGVMSEELGIKVYQRNKKKSKMGARTYACSSCGFAVMGKVSFTTKKNLLTWHFQTVHNWTQFQCAVCGFQDDFYDNVKMHINEHHVDPEFQCRVCRRCWYDEDDIKAHVMKHEYQKRQDSTSMDQSKPRKKLYQTNYVTKIRERLKDLFEEKIVLVHNRDIKSICQMMYTCVHCDLRVLELNEDGYGLAMQQHVLQCHHDVSVRNLAAPDFDAVDLKNCPHNSSDEDNGNKKDEEEEEETPKVVHPGMVRQGQGCPHCSFMIFSGKMEAGERSRLLAEHFHHIHNLIQFKCVLCPYQSNDRSDVMNHVQNRHVICEFRCKICRKYWTNETEVNSFDYLL